MKKSVFKRFSIVKQLGNKLMALQSLTPKALETGFNQEKLANIRTSLDKLAAEQQAISDIANTPENEPALQILPSKPFLSRRMVQIFQN